MDILHLPKQPGIYAIRCLTNRKFYVGSAVNVRGRLGDHRKVLRSGTHPNRHLLAAWAKYGEASFHCEVLEEVADCSTLIKREQFWIDVLRAADRGFNLSPKAGSRLGCVVSDEGRQNISLGARNRIRQGRLGTKHTAETKAKFSAIHKGKKNPPHMAEQFAKEYDFVTPGGECIHVRNLREFCRETGLDRANMSRLANRKQRQHKGWTLPPLIEALSGD